MATARKAKTRTASNLFLALFNNRSRRATIFASVPWFLQDLGTYGDASYPLINYEYVLVSSRVIPATADAMRHFLLWAIALNGGNAPKYLDPVGFVPLPDFIRALSEHQINRIK